MSLLVSTRKQKKCVSVSFLLDEGRVTTSTGTRPETTPGLCGDRYRKDTMGPQEDDLKEKDLQDETQPETT